VTEVVHTASPWTMEDIGEREEARIGDDSKSVSDFAGAQSNSSATC